MPPDRKYGKHEGLRERLLDWANRMSNDKSWPWVGLGIIDDIELAASLLPDPPMQEFDL